MKHLLAFLCASLLLAATAPIAAAQTTEEVVSLVQQTKDSIEKNVFQALARINRGDHPYRNTDNPALYVFVLDTNLNLVAHYKTSIVGRNMKGKPDAKGKMFRDEILSKAMKDGTGWVDYHFEHPKTKELAHKNTFLKLTTGSNGEQYIVCSGKYL